ncbi:hypothetical protein ACF0H5_011243 [Mactra antiquata]
MAAEDIVEEYQTSLKELNFNSKPHISMLTMLADDHSQHASEIVTVIEAHINKCKAERKLPILYLMDSIMKNLEKTSYRSLFATNIVQTFTSVFEQVGEKTRASMYKLRQTWTDVLPNTVLYRIDVRIKNFLDPAWPITAKEPEKASIHVNPKFLQGNSEGERSSPECFEDSPDEVEEEEDDTNVDEESIIRQKLIAKNKELLQLKEARLKLELAEAEEKLKLQKKGSKSHAKSSSFSAISVPLSVTETVSSTIPDVKPPVDPRPRPTDPRLRDPRLKNKIISTSGHHSSQSNISAQSSVSSQPAYQALSLSSAYSAQQVETKDPRLLPYSIEQLVTPAVPYGLASRMPVSGSHGADIFTGEVFTPDSAKFSDDNDSDSSRSSLLESRPTMATNIRDPRRRMNRDKNEVNIKSEHSTSRSALHADRHSSKHHSSESRDPRKQVENVRGRNSKEKEISSYSPRKSSSSTSAKHHSRSREKDFNAKQKELLEAEKNMKEEMERKLREEMERKLKEEIKREEMEKRKREEAERKKREEAERKKKEEKEETEKRRREEVERKRKEEIERKRKEEIERKKAEKREEKERKRKEVERQFNAWKAEEERKSKIAMNESKVDSGKISKKKASKGLLLEKDDIKEEPVDMDVQEKATVSRKHKSHRETEKRSSGDKMDLDRAAKKLKLDSEEVSVKIENSGETMDVLDKDCHEQDMDLESDSETNDVPTKIEEDISDLFGDEDEDYRPAVQKPQLPLKSPSSKGWDQFKATHSDQYAYDIELKKMRQDSVTEQKHTRMEDSIPQDEDLRVMRPDYQQQLSSSSQISPSTSQISPSASNEQIEVPKQLSIDQHAEILLEANKQLTKGILSHEQYQELVKQLSELVEIQKLQEQSRRASEEINQSTVSPVNAVPVISAPEISERELVREVRSPDKPLDPFRIPKKRADGKKEEDRSQSELSRLYPESPVNKFGPSAEPFQDTDEVFRKRNTYYEQAWHERGDEKRQYGDQYADRHGSNDGRMDIFSGPGERFPRQLNERDNRRVPPDSERFWDDNESTKNKSQGDRRCLLKSPPRDPEIKTEVKSPKGPYRDEQDWRNENMDEDRNKSGRGRGQKGRGRGRRGKDRRDDDRDRFEPSRDDTGYRDDIQTSDREWLDTRRQDERAEKDKHKSKEFDPRGLRDKFSNERGNGPRFRDDRFDSRDESESRLESRRGRGANRRDLHDRQSNRDHDRDARKEQDSWGGNQSNWKDDRSNNKRGIRDNPWRGGQREPEHEVEQLHGRSGQYGRNEAQKHLLPTPQDQPMEKGRQRDGPRSRRDRGPAEDIRPGCDNDSNMMDHSHRQEWQEGPRSDEPRDFNLIDPFIDKFGDPRYRCFADVGPQVMEEVAIGKKNFEIKVGGPPRKIKWNNGMVEVFADPVKRGITIDKKLVYRFGEKVKDVIVRGTSHKFFYHGRPLDLWVEGQHYDVRVDAPPKNIIINGKNHKIKIDGRDMMILIDNEEKGRFGGEPRFIIVEDERMELRFEPPPRFILIDGNQCELKLNMQQPCVNIKGILHGIRFDGPPRDLIINEKLYQIYTDHAVKLRVGSRFYYVALGGPCHELIIDGKWYEVGFDSPPKEINIGKQVLMVQLPGPPPDVKILPEIAQEPRPLPPGIIMQGQRLPRMLGPGLPNVSGPSGPDMPPYGPGPGMPPDMRPGLGPRHGMHDMGPSGLGPGMPDMGPPGLGPMPGMPDMGPPGLGPRPGMPDMGPPGLGPGPGHGMQNIGPPGPGGPMPHPGMMEIRMQGPGPNEIKPLLPPGQESRSMPPPGMMMGPPRSMMGPPGSMPRMGPSPLPPMMDSTSMSGPNQMPGQGPPVSSSVSNPLSNMPNVLSSLFPPVQSTTASSTPIDINNLLAKLVNTGIIKKEPVSTSTTSIDVSTRPSTSLPSVKPEYSNAIIAQKKPAVKVEKFDEIADMTEMNPTEMKCLPTGMIQRLYSGIQCTSCGQRFATADGEKTEQYRQHLDWHFRQNRKGKDDTKVSQCRKWYYGIDDWILYEEVIDREESGKSNFFEQQQQQQPVESTPTTNTLSLMVPDGVHIEKCPAATGNDDEDLCNICREQFELYWDEELEEWHLRDAIKVNNKTYHPICYEDHTDVSEGTPSPSVLNVTEPGFKSKRSLMYDEASEDVPSSTEDIKSQQTMETDMGHLPDVTVKSEPIEHSLNDSVVDTSSPFLSNIKLEPGSIPFLTDNLEESKSDSTENTHSLSDSENVKVKTEAIEAEATVKTEESDSVNEVVNNQFSNTSLTVVKEEPQPGSVGNSSAVKSVTDNIEKSVKMESGMEEMETDTDTTNNDIVKPDASERLESSMEISDKSENKENESMESAICTETPTLGLPDDADSNTVPVESDPLPAVSNDPTSLLPDIHVDTSDAHLNLPESSAINELQHSPTYSMLNKVKLNVAQEPLDISPEVLEIGSNASTPTRDELPSPECDDS